MKEKMIRILFAMISVVIIGGYVTTVDAAEYDEHDFDICEDDAANFMEEEDFGEDMNSFDEEIDDDDGWDTEVVEGYMDLEDTVLIDDGDFGEDMESYEEDIDIDDSFELDVDEGYTDEEVIERSYMGTMEAYDGVTVKKQRLSMADINRIILQKGRSSLTWKDFEKYDYKDIGSGLYIYAYEMENDCKLYISGGDISKRPWHIYVVDGRGRKKDLK